MVQYKSLPKFLHFHFCFNNIVIAKIKSFMNLLNFELKSDTNIKSLNIHKTQKHQLLVRIILTVNKWRIMEMVGSFLNISHFVWSKWISRPLLQSLDFRCKSYIQSSHISECGHIIRMNLRELICEIKLWKQNESKYSHNITFQSIYI